MKLLTVFSFLFIFLMLNAFTQKAEAEVQEPKPSPLEVCAIHQLELKADTDAKEFEAYVMKEIAPIYNRMKGQNFHLAKGDRGVRTNKYAIILTFDSIEDRDRIYPPSGEYVGDFGDASVWEKFDSYLVEGLGRTHTDYLIINQ